LVFKSSNQRKFVDLAYSSIEQVSNFSYTALGWSPSLAIAASLRQRDALARVTVTHPVVCLSPIRVLHQSMGNHFSSTAGPVLQNEITLQVPIQPTILPSIPPLIPASIPLVEPSVSEIRRPRSRQGIIKSVKSAKSARRSPQVESSYARPRVKSAPQKVPALMDKEDAPPLPHPRQRCRAKSSTASSSRSPNSDHRQMSAGEHDDDRTRAPSLTMIRTLEGISQTTGHELSRPASTQFNSPSNAPRKLQVCTSALSPMPSLIYFP
jgi:hypothetical protein